MKWLINLVRGRRIGHELSEEVEAHIQERADDLTETGLSAKEAHQAARREFGNAALHVEASREVWGWAWFDRFTQDLRYGLRQMRRSPLFTAMAVLSLALGIGANTAIFSAIETMMLRMLPVRSPQELFAFTGENPSGADWALWPYGWYERWHDRVRTFSGVTATSLIDRSNVLFRGPAGVSEVSSLKVGLVAGNYFQTLGVNPAIGRTLTPDDDRAQGAHPVAVISDGFWERRFGRAPDVVGRTFTLNGASFVIIGVAAAGFSGDVVGQPADLWIPLAMQTQAMPERPNLLDSDWRTGWAWLRIIGRLKPGTSAQQAGADATLVYRQFQRERADELGYTLSPGAPLRQVNLLPAAKGHSPARARFAQPLEILMIVVGLVLLVACANVASLLLVRSAARQREMAARLAIGASRGRLIRQLLTESILLAMMSGVLGLLFAQWGTASLLNLVSSGFQPVSLDLHPNGRVLGFTTLLCLLTSILFGLAPALRASGTALSSALNGRGGSESASLAGGRASFSAGRLLVISQIALSLVLMFAAGLFTLTLHNLKTQELGLDREQVLMIWADPSQSGQTGPAVVGLHRTILERVSALPGVVSASESLYGLLNGREFTNPSETLSVEGQPPRPGQRWIPSMVAPRFFETLGIPLVAGRDFSAADTGPTSPRVAIVNETMAHFYFGSGNPLGRHFLVQCRNCVLTEIVGVVKDAKYAPRQQHLAIVYNAYRQSDIRASSPMFVAVRTTGNPAGLAAAIRQELRRIDPGLPVRGINTVEQQLNEILVEERLIASLSLFFGALAVLLACLGLYGVVSYTVALRRSEIGVRMALGATGADVLRMVLKESMVLVVAGVAIGMPAALASARVISNRLFGIGTADPLMISGSAALMIGVAVLASLLPARRAARVDPMTALRCD